MLFVVVVVGVDYRRIGEIYLMLFPLYGYNMFIWGIFGAFGKSKIEVSRALQVYSCFHCVFQRYWDNVELCLNRNGRYWRTFFRWEQKYLSGRKQFSRYLVRLDIFIHFSFYDDNNDLMCKLKRAVGMLLLKTHVFEFT